MYARRPSIRKSKGGVSRIRRDSYATNSGFTEKNSWWSLRKSAMERSEGMCDEPGCRSVAKEVHHIVPLSRGGRNILSNLMCLCKSCHDKRHNHLYRGR